MTPLALEMLIWFHTRAPEAGPFPNIGREPQWEIVSRFVADGIIVTNGDQSVFKTTDRGDAWLKLCLGTPMPVQVWADPRNRQTFDIERFMQDDSNMPA